MSAEAPKQDVPKPKILTVEMVRKRAEHNDGVLCTLEEVAMHQDEIGKLTKVFERYTPRLRILYLQNNYIEKIEHLGGLVELEYLNLALNNISHVEGLERCESLTKLDLTCNFVADVVDLESLQDLKDLHELYLTGNPCDRFEDYRPFVIATLPQLLILDGTEITHSERTRSLERYKNENLREKMLQQASVCEKGRYTPEERLAAWQEIEMRREENKPKPTPSVFNQTIPKPKPPPDGPDENGHIRQTNMGNWVFKWYERNGKLCLDVNIDRYLDTSLIDIVVHPTWIRITAKEKVLQLVLPSEVTGDNVEALRSQTTGHLLVKMEVVDPTKIPVISKS